MPPLRELDLGQEVECQQAVNVSTVSFDLGHLHPLEQVLMAQFLQRAADQGGALLTQLRIKGVDLPALAEEVFTLVEQAEAIVAAHGRPPGSPGVINPYYSFWMNAIRAAGPDLIEYPAWKQAMQAFNLNH